MLSPQRIHRSILSSVGGKSQSHDCVGVGSFSLVLIHASIFCFQNSALTRPSTGRAKARRLSQALACEKPALFSPMFYSPAFIFSSDYSLGFWFLAGLRLLVLRQFSAFLPAVRRLRGAVLFPGLRPSSIWGFPFWFLGLTGQSSRPAFGGRLTFVR